MQALRCLYLEDNEEHAKRFQAWIERAWNKLEKNVPIEITPLVSPDDVATKLQEAKEPFHLLIADILIGKTRDAEPLGLTAIAQAREAFPNLAIIALTVGGKGLEHKTIEAGADDYISKPYLTGNPTSPILGDKILSALRKHGQEPMRSDVKTFFADEKDIQLGALIETIGKETILDLIRRLTKHDMSKVTATFIRAGLSGAAVLRVDCEVVVPEGNPPQKQQLLLKMSPSISDLSIEVNKNVSMFPDGIFVPLLKNTIGPENSGAWYAIAGLFKNNAKTLIDWLNQSEIKDADVSKVLSILFLDDGLHQMYTSVGWRENERPNSLLWQWFSVRRRAQVSSTMKDLALLVKSHDPLNFYEESLITRFIGSAVRINNIDEQDVPLGVATCWSHGDLHGRNILIDMIGRPTLIDRATVDTLHWALDTAKLIVDLIVSGWDQGPVSHEWQSMDEWCNLAKSCIEGTDIPSLAGDHPNSHVRSALFWMRQNLRKIHDPTANHPKREWEFRLALALEFLRSSYRVDISTPKKVLCLLAACEAIRSAALEFQKQPERLVI
jgi:CheY-like chemotaxis protein